MGDVSIYGFESFILFPCLLRLRRLCSVVVQGKMYEVIFYAGNSPDVASAVIYILH